MNSLSPATSTERAPAADEPPVGHAHWWFTALDQRPLAVGPERWLTQVVGVHTDGSDVWIQLLPLREQLRDFTIRVSPGMSLDDVLGEIQQLIREAARPSR